MQQSILMNFGHLGLPGWTPVHPIEMEVIWEGVLEMFENYDAASIEGMTQRVEHKLMCYAIGNLPINDEWVTNALLVTAIRGWQGKEIPDLIYIED